MDDIFHKVSLQAKNAREAYPLVRLCHSSVTLDQWLSFARRLARLPRHRGGLFAVKDKRGYVHAVFSYRIDSDMRHGPVLRVSDLIIGRLAGRTIDRVIVKAAEQLALEIGCFSIVVELPQSAEGEVDIANYSVLVNAGFSPCAISFQRPDPRSRSPLWAARLR